MICTFEHIQNAVDRNCMIADTEVIQGTWHRLVFGLICSGCNKMHCIVRTSIVHINMFQVYSFCFVFVHNFMLFYKCPVNNNNNDERNDINNDLEISGVINFELKTK